MSNLARRALLMGALFSFSLSSAQTVSEGLFDAMFWTGQQVAGMAAIDELDALARQAVAPRNFVRLGETVFSIAAGTPLLDSAMAAMYEFHTSIIYAPLDSFWRHKTGNVRGLPGVYPEAHGDWVIWYSNYPTGPLTSSEGNNPLERPPFTFAIVGKTVRYGVSSYSLSISPNLGDTTCTSANHSVDRFGDAPNASRAAVASNFTNWVSTVAVAGGCVGKDYLAHFSNNPESADMLGGSYIPSLLSSRPPSLGSCSSGPFGGLAVWGGPVDPSTEHPSDGMCGPESGNARIPTPEEFADRIIVDWGDAPVGGGGGGESGGRDDDYNPPPPETDPVDYVIDTCGPSGSGIACDTTLNNLLEEAARDQDYSGFVRAFEDTATFSESRWQRRDFSVWVPGGGGGGSSGGRVDLSRSRVAGVADEFTTTLDAQLDAVRLAADSKVPFGFITWSEGLQFDVSTTEECPILQFPSPLEGSFNLCDNPADAILSGPFRTLLATLVYLGFALQIVRLSFAALP